MKKMSKKEKKKSFALRRITAVFTAGLMVACCTVPVFAAGGQLQTGKNFGEWALNQIWYIALAICAAMIVRYMAKKAWVQMVIFIVLGALCIYLVAEPESLKGIGASLFRMI